MTLTVDLFWSFRSPYSYLALAKIARFVADHDLEIRARPVYPLAIRMPDFFERTNPLFLSYVARDARRVAECEGIPFRPPRHDPIVQDRETREIAAEQPYIHRLTRLGAAAQHAGRAYAFIGEASRVLWDGSVENWHQGDHLAGAAARAGFDLAALDAAVQADPAAHDAIIADNQRDHAASGHWGVPTFVFNGEPFYGQDRIDLLVWRMRQHGLSARNQA